MTTAQTAQQILKAYVAGKQPLDAAMTAVLEDWEQAALTQVRELHDALPNNADLRKGFAVALGNIAGDYVEVALATASPERLPRAVRNALITARAALFTRLKVETADWAKLNAERV